MFKIQIPRATAPLPRLLSPACSRQSAREACYAEAAKWWRPSWSSSSPDTDKYMSATAGKSVQQIIREAAAALRGITGR